MRRTLPLILTLSVIALSACSSSKKVQDNQVIVIPDNGPTLDPAAAKQSFSEANQLLSSGNYDAAIAKYKESTSQNPEPWEVYMNQAIATILNGRSDTAIQLMGQSFEHGGDKHAVAYYNLGNLYQERGLYYAAVDAYRAALAQGNADDEDILLNLAAAYLLLPDYPKAELTYERITELYPTSPAPIHGMGLISQLKQDYKNAIKYYDEVKSRFPGFAPTWFNRGYLLMSMKKYQDAVDAFETYLQLAPKGPYVVQANAHITALRQSYLNKKL